MQQRARTQVPTWAEVKLHNGLVIARDTVGRLFEIRDLGAKEELRRMPDPPPADDRASGRKIQR